MIAKIIFFIFSRVVVFRGSYFIEACFICRYKYESDTSRMVATLSNSSCSVGSTSVNNPDKTGRVQKTFKKKRDREPSQISLHRVKKLLKEASAEMHSISSETKFSKLLIHQEFLYQLQELVNLV